MRAAAAALFCCALVGDFSDHKDFGNGNGERFGLALEVTLEAENGLFETVPHEGSGGNREPQTDEADGEIAERTVRSHYFVEASDEVEGQYVDHVKAVTDGAEEF